LFDLRYHVASLAAVFLALIIGILVGVGISSQTDVSSSERQVFEQEIANLRSDVEQVTAEADLLRRQQEAGTRYIEQSYPTVMNGRLRGIRVALLFVGPVKSELKSAVTRTLDDASGPALARMRALELPVDASAVMNAIPTDSGTLTLEEIGRRLGGELVKGDETPLWDALGSVIVQEDEGGNTQPADAVVVAQTARVDHPPTGRLVAGIYAGLAGSGAPVVGIERTDEQPSRIAIYRTRGLSSVDSVDTLIGRVALAVLLAGGEEGHYGLDANSDSVVPPIEPLELAPSPSG
jgi:hypothetical protein